MCIHVIGAIFNGFCIKIHTIYLHLTHNMHDMKLNNLLSAHVVMVYAAVEGTMTS